MPIHVLSQDGQSILVSRDTLMGGGGCSAHPCTVLGWSEYLRISDVLSWDGQSISGSRDTLTGSAVPIHVLSRDDQSILGSRDTLTGRGGGGGGGCSAHPCTVPGWSEYHRSARWDGVGCTFRCYPGKVRVFRELWPGTVQPIFYLKNFYAIRWRHWTSLVTLGWEDVCSHRDPVKTRFSKNFPLTGWRNSTLCCQLVNRHPAALIYPGLFLTLVGLCDVIVQCMIFIDSLLVFIDNM